MGALVDPAAAEEGTVPTALFASETSGEDIPQAPGDGMRTSEKDIRVRPTEENLKGRPPGDNRSAEQIIDENPVLKNLGNQKDIKQAELKERFGDWTDANKDPKSRADAAYNMACVLNSIKGLNARDGSERKEISANDKIEGITKDGDARHGTEAGVLKDIAEQGLKMLPENKQLPETNDSHAVWMVPIKTTSSGAWVSSAKYCRTSRFSNLLPRLSLTILAKPAMWAKSLPVA
ncbi:MAG: hypothetical protein MUW55_07150 [Pantoea vagans]|nr:hypothetical protein [Pantoea vagans]